MNLKRNFGGAIIPRYKLRAFLPVFSAFLTPTKIELKCEVSWYPQSLTVSFIAVFFLRVAKAVNYYPTTCTYPLLSTPAPDV